MAISKCGKHSAAVVVAKAQAVLSEPELMRAMFDVGYFPPYTPPGAVLDAAHADAAVVARVLAARDLHRRRRLYRRHQCGVQGYIRVISDRSTLSVEYPFYLR